MSPRKQGKLFGLVTSVVVAASLLVPAAAHAADVTSTASAAGPAPCRAAAGLGGSVLTLKSFYVTAKPAKKVVSPGDKVKVKIKVTRPAHEDPFDQDIQLEPPVSTPEKDVSVGVAVWVGKYTYFWNMGITDENGEETFTLRIPEDSELGNAYAVASAEKWLKRDCPDIVERGFHEYENFLTIVP